CNSPGRQPWVQSATVIHSPERATESVAPPGLGVISANPGLTPWANNYRPFGAETDGHGFSPAAHAHGTRWQPGQPPTYLAVTAASRSTPAVLASVASQASTSANSAANSARAWPPRRAAANSPTSSMNHMKVPSMPRRASLAPNVSRI